MDELEQKRLLLQAAEAKIANQRQEIINLKQALGYKERKPPPKPNERTEALRRAGYVVVPRLWVTQDQLEVIERMASGNKDEVWRIKHGDPD
jgi:hypothetical protein